MPRRMKQSLASLCAALVLLAFFGVNAAHAAVSANGVRISPVRTDVTINPGQSQTVTVNVTNITSVTATYQAVVNDFTSNPDESGNPALIQADGQYASSHSLKRFISPISNFTLKPGEQKAVQVNVVVPKDAAGGGYFAAVRFGPATSKAESGQNISLAANAGSLILVTVPGDIKEQLSVASFDVRSNDRPNTFFLHGKGLVATIRFQNEGNIQEAPFGKVILKNHSGKVLGTYEINTDTPPSNVLPDGIRRFTVPLKGIGSFGKYRVEGNFGYGSNGQLLSASTTFYVIPILLILLFIAIVAFLVFLVVVLPKVIRAYNRRVIRNAGRKR